MLRLRLLFSLIIALMLIGLSQTNGNAQEEPSGSISALPNSQQRDQNLQRLLQSDRNVLSCGEEHYCSQGDGFTLRQGSFLSLDFFGLSCYDLGCVLSYGILDVITAPIKLFGVLLGLKCGSCSE